MNIILFLLIKNVCGVLVVLVVFLVMVVVFVYV